MEEKILDILMNCGWKEREKTILNNFCQVGDAKQEVTGLWSFTQVALVVSTKKKWILENVFLSLSQP